MLYPLADIRRMRDAFRKANDLAPHIPIKYRIGVMALVGISEDLIEPSNKDHALLGEIGKIDGFPVVLTSSDPYCFDMAVFSTLDSHISTGRRLPEPGDHCCGGKVLSYSFDSRGEIVGVLVRVDKQIDFMDDDDEFLQTTTRVKFIPLEEIFLI